MNHIHFFSILACFSILLSCSKEEEASVYKEPIAVLQPSTNPANIVKGSPIKYDVRFTTDEYIDSLMVFIQIDTAGTGYDNTKSDSLIQKVVYKVGNQKNEQSLTNTFTPWMFPNAGRKIFITFRMRSKSRVTEKRLSLIVT